MSDNSVLAEYEHRGDCQTRRDSLKTGGMNAVFKKHEWEELIRLRQRFLERDWDEDYWENLEQLRLYDLSFAQRISWKWESLLRRMPIQIGKLLQEEDLSVLDWGCGSGIAGRVFANSFSLKSYLPWDRSNLARRYAADKLLGQHPELQILDSVEGWSQQQSKKVVLLSHALGELQDLESLLPFFESADWIFVVEPGDKQSSKKLVKFREKLIQEWCVVFPCPHKQTCPLVGNKKDWCHFFARAPGEVHHSPFWSKFSEELKIDLRSLPFSCLVLSRKSIKPSHSEILIGKARILKGHCSLKLCISNGKIEKQALTRSKDKERFKKIKKDPFNLPE